MNPWERLRPPGKIEDMEEEVFTNVSKAAKRISFRRNEVYTARKRELARIKAAHRILRKHLNRCIDIGKAYIGADPFYRDILSLFFKEDNIISHYKRIKGLSNILDRLLETYSFKISKARNPPEMAKYRKEALARMMSVVKRRPNLIQFFIEIHRFASRLPSISKETPLVIVGGPPNVGKSSLVREISTAHPEVAEYPFTTKKISLGHVTMNRHVIQIMDTPGLLDRPMNERNPIEKQAILAIRHLADILIFMFDPSPMRYYPIEKQIHILNEIEEHFTGLDIILVSNKADIKEIDVTRYIKEKVIETSLLTGQGLDELRSELYVRLSRLTKTL